MTTRGSRERDGAVALPHPDYIAPKQQPAQVDPLPNGEANQTDRYPATTDKLAAQRPIRHRG